MKRGILIAFFLCMLLQTICIRSIANAEGTSYWTDKGIAATSFAGGTGTEDDPFLIENENQLAYLANQVNQSIRIDNPSEGKYYKLLTDLDMSRYLWTPIGMEGPNSDSFGGSFDGNNKSIIGMKYIATTDKFSQAGLFGSTYGDGYIKNITVSGSIQLSTTTGTEIGAIVGYCEKDIINCHSDVDISVDVTFQEFGGGCYIGGLTARSFGKSIINCSSRGSFNITYVCPYENRYGEFGVGGLSYFAGGSGKYENNYYTGNITVRGEDPLGEINAGGLFATYQDEERKASLKNCYAAGDITILGDALIRAGALVGWMVENPHQNCYWLESTSVIPIDTNNDGVGNGRSGILSFSFSADGNVWRINNTNHDDLISTLNAWVNEKADLSYHPWRAATFANENGGFPVHDSFDVNTNDDLIIGLAEGKTYYKGQDIPFSVVGAGMNRYGVYGVYRHRPSSWIVGSTSGTWNDTSFTANIATEKMAIGSKTLSVTYLEEWFNGNSWAQTGDTLVKNISFELQKAPLLPPTGDTTVDGHILGLWVFTAGMLLVLAGLVRYRFCKKQVDEENKQ